MAVLFQRRLAMPVWAVAFFTVALTAPPTATLFLMPPATVFAIAAVGIAAIVFLMPGAITRLRASRSLVRVVPSEGGQLAFAQDMSRYRAYVLESNLDSVDRIGAAAFALSRSLTCRSGDRPYDF